MKSAFGDLELILNREVVSAIFAQVNSLGRLLICDGCGDVEAVIMGFLVLDRIEQAWALCGACVRRIPLFSTMT
jgi:hypothetical protein